MNREFMCHQLFFNSFLVFFSFPPDMKNDFNKFMRSFLLKHFPFISPIKCDQIKSIRIESNVSFGVAKFCVPLDFCPYPSTLVCGMIKSRNEINRKAIPSCTIQQTKKSKTAFTSIRYMQRNAIGGAAKR